MRPADDRRRRNFRKPAAVKFPLGALRQLGAHSSVDHEQTACHEAALRRSQVKHGLRYLVRRAVALERKPSINDVLARGVGTDVQRAIYNAPSSMFQGSSAS